eukprot:m.206382 g.206382  ORF g.206382 m.206382 type:complete len:71 (-) comp15023_c1_seq1:58-270(-)
MSFACFALVPLCLFYAPVPLPDPCSPHSFPFTPSVSTHIQTHTQTAPMPSHATLCHLLYLSLSPDATQPH